MVGFDNCSGRSVGRDSRLLLAEEGVEVNNDNVDTMVVIVGDEPSSPNTSRKTTGDSMKCSEGQSIISQEL